MLPAKWLFGWALSRLETPLEEIVLLLPAVHEVWQWEQVKFVIEKRS